MTQRSDTVKVAFGVIDLWEQIKKAEGGPLRPRDIDILAKAIREMDKELRGYKEALVQVGRLKIGGVTVSIRAYMGADR